MVNVVTILLVVLAATACGGSEEDGPAIEHEDSTPESTAPLTLDPTPTFEREQIEISWLREGNFWRLAWSEVESTRTWTERGGTADSRTYTIRLGNRRDVNGFEMYPIDLTGDAGDFSPGWDLVGTDTFGGIYGMVDGNTTPVLLYSLHDVRTPVIGFHANFASGKDISIDRSSRMIPSQYTRQVSVFDGPVAGVGYSAGGKQVFRGAGCDYFAGVGTICGGGTTLGPSREETHIENWSDEAGPVGMHYSFDFEDCLGTACDEKHIEQRVELRFFGDPAESSVGYETEPDTYVEPTEIDLSGSFFTTLAEINEFDLPSGFIEGVVAQSGMDVAAQIHDWFRFEVGPGDGTREFVVVWDDSTIDLDVFVFTAIDNQQYGFLQIGEGTELDDDSQSEEGKFVSGTFEPGPYLIGVRLPGGSNITVPYGLIAITD